MKDMSRICLGIVATCIASAVSATVSTPPPTPPTPPDEPIHVVVLWDDTRVEQTAWSITKYICTEYANGCPKNSAVIDTETGEIAGCVSNGATPPVCSGECQICKGGATVAKICKKTNVATDTCGASFGTGISVDCGLQSTQTCAVGGNAGPNGCGCPTPTAYTGNVTCKLIQCETP